MNFVKGNHFSLAVPKKGSRLSIGLSVISPFLMVKHTMLTGSWNPRGGSRNLLSIYIVLIIWLFIVDFPIKNGDFPLLC